MKGLGVALMVCLLATLLPAHPVPALDLREWVPGLTVSPFLGERVEYESNVFQAPSHAKGDVIFKTIPGFLADYNFGPHSLSGGYRAEILRYVDLTNQDTTNHFAVGQLRLDFPRLLVNIREDFAHTTDPPGTELTGPIESDTSILTPEIEYGLTQRFSVGVNYSWTHVHFQPSVDELDRNEHLVGASVFWRFLPKTDLRLSYGYGEKDFTVATDRDVTRHVVTLGLRGDLTAKISSGSTTTPSRRPWTGGRSSATTHSTGSGRGWNTRSSAGWWWAPSTHTGPGGRISTRSTSSTTGSSGR